MIEKDDPKTDQNLIQTLIENQYSYYFPETGNSTGTSSLEVKSLSDQPLWSCQSIDFGKKIGFALKDLHNILNDSKSIAKNKISIKSQLSFSERLKFCEKLWRSHEDQFEEVGFPISVLREVFMGYEDLEIENEQVILHGNLSSPQILVNANMEFIGFNEWSHLQVGNRGLDIALAWMIFEEPVAKAFFSAYGPIEETQFELSLFQSLYHPMVMLPYSFKNQNESLKQWTVFALRKAIGL